MNIDKNVNIILEKLKKIPNCEGIIYAGSRVDGDFSKNSDYDFTVLISQGKSYYKIFNYKNLLVDICCATEKIIKEQDLNRKETSNPELAIIANGNIIFDKSGQTKKIQNKAKQIWKLGPNKPTKQDLVEAGYLCTTFLHKLSKKNSDQAFYHWNDVMKKMLNIFFKLHYTWQPKFFEVENTIKNIDSNFFKIYKKVYNDKNQQIKIQSTKKLIKYIVKKFNLPQTGEVYFPKD
ncbi:MAG: nucleotidyltransferase domain-containing protein [Patescibacteria group bacterium]|nr:nucleotidyltransferase domain-containing protein [Patescibacteria group bacterium]